MYNCYSMYIAVLFFCTMYLHLQFTNHFAEENQRDTYATNCKNPERFKQTLWVHTHTGFSPMDPQINMHAQTCTIRSNPYERTLWWQCGYIFIQFYKQEPHFQLLKWDPLTLSSSADSSKLFKSVTLVNHKWPCFKGSYGGRHRP